MAIYPIALAEATNGLPQDSSVYSDDSFLKSGCSKTSRVQSSFKQQSIKRRDVYKYSALYEGEQVCLFFLAAVVVVVVGISLSLFLSRLSVVKLPFA